MWLADRARIANRAGDTELARRSVAEARQAAAHIADGAVRELAEAHIAVETAAAERATDPRNAIAMLRGVEPFFAKAPWMLPYVHLQLARAQQAAGDGTAAVAEYAATLRALEQQAASADQVAFFDTASQAIDESIALLLARGQIAAALEVADRRHRLHPRAATAATQAVRQPLSDRVVLEYAVLRHALVTFCIKGADVEAKTAAIDREELASLIDAFNGKLRRRAPIEEESAALYRLLIKPFEQRLSGELVIVPDRQLYALPFAALYDEATGRYLIEQTVVRMAPAASGAAAERVDALTPALVVADPPLAGQPPLAASREEAASIARIHHATLLSTLDQFPRLAAQSALIHYAGHGEGALLLASQLSRLRLTARPLVVLAACGTFRGETAHVAGMSSAARAFLFAGARGVVGTLWEVDDDVAATVSIQLHTNLHAGASPARALREAQLSLLRSPDAHLAHPAAWAPFELFSDY
jgi:CHAT domain-containing protein